MKGSVGFFVLLYKLSRIWDRFLLVFMPMQVLLTRAIIIRYSNQIQQYSAFHASSCRAKSLHTVL